MSIKVKSKKSKQVSASEVATSPVEQKVKRTRKARPAKSGVPSTEAVATPAPKKRKERKLTTGAGRAPGQTQISISLSAELVEKIDALAAEDNRTRSNYIALSLTKLVARLEAKSA